MNVLVTGGAGFIGSNLVRALLDRGDQVTVLDNFDDAYDPSLKEQNLIGLPIELIHGDIRDRAAMDQALRGIDAVVHLAARAGVRESLENPGLYASVNVGGTVNVLEALKEKLDIPLVFASSSSVYGERSDGPFVETDDLGFPASPYAGSKRSAELMCHAAHTSTGQRVTALRFFTVYGPRQRPAMAIARFVRMARAGETIPVYGGGSSQRDYTYVDDAVRAILASLDDPQDFAVFNVGGGNPIRLDDLVRAVGEVTGCDIKTEVQPVQPGDVSLTWANPALIEEVLGWKAKVSVLDGLRQYVEWLER